MSGALNKIKQVRRRYILYHLMADALIAAAITISVVLMLNIAFGASFFYLLPLFVIICGLFVVNRRLWLINDKAVAGFLDSAYPELEESSYLLLTKATELNLLQQLQLNKVSVVIQQIPANHKAFTKRLRYSAVFLSCVLLLVFAINHLPVNRSKSSKNSIQNNAGKIPLKEVILPEVKSVNITITPPSYTHLTNNKQDKFTIETVESATVIWKLTTNIQVKKVSLLFNGKENRSLTNVANDQIHWTAQKVIESAGFYQVVIDGKLSDLYQVQVTKDAPPVIQIKTPKQFTYIDAGEKPQVNLQASVTDDYGVSDAMIYATVAKGSGEAVKFKEQKISFATSFNQTLHNYNLQKIIDLPALGLEPGDELYFYIQARDSHAQLSRTDVYIVSIQDTAQLMSMDGILSGINIKPEYFRSERQIILDAEALIKAKDTLKEANFKDRSNDLGTDQKLLRLRYGKFLGEEAEGNIADPRLEGNTLSNPSDFGNGAKIKDEYTDKHDNAEDAQFFDPSVKAQLKATLTEMWKAELQLRLYKPQEALPFAYKALRLLKDLQQKSRSYVAKTAYNPSPLKMEKRLTGDLDKITQPTDHQDIKQQEDNFSSLKSAASLLDQLHRLNSLNSSDYRILQAANLQINSLAVLQPGIYLGAASAMRRIMAGNKKSLATDAATVETAIQKMLPIAPSLPQSQSSSADLGLSKTYFLKLKHTNR